jgi:ribosomal protein L35
MTRSSVVKRIKISKKGLLMRRKMAQDHFRAKKSGSVIQGKRKPLTISKADAKRVINFMNS